jgi:hypothetical protein
MKRVIHVIKIDLALAEKECKNANKDACPSLINREHLKRFYMHCDSSERKEIV